MEKAATKDSVTLVQIEMVAIQCCFMTERHISPASYKLQLMSNTFSFVWDSGHSGNAL